MLHLGLVPSAPATASFAEVAGGLRSRYNENQFLGNVPQMPLSVYDLLVSGCGVTRQIVFLSSHGYSALRTSSLSRRPSAAAMELATSIPTFTLPSSIELTYVRCTFARSANSSWDSESLSRAKRMDRPKLIRENLVAFGTPHFQYPEDDQSTDDPLHATNWCGGGGGSTVGYKGMKGFHDRKSARIS